MEVYNGNPSPRGHHGNGGFFTWLRHPQRGLPYLICSILIILVFLPFMIHYYLSNYGLDYDNAQYASSHPKADGLEEFGPIRTSDIHFQIQELKNIRTSVNNELLELEKKRQTLQSLITSYNEAIENLKQTYQTTSQELDRLKVTFKNLQAEHEELLHNKIPHIEAPKRILANLDDAVTVPLNSPSVRCRLHSCFDFSRCSLTSQFPIYVYSLDEFKVTDDLEAFIKYSVTRAFASSPYLTYDPFIACVYVVLIGENRSSSSGSLKERLGQLPYWNNGANHLLIHLSRSPINSDIFDNVDTGRALVASSLFSESNFRTGFDIILPPALGISHGEVWHQLPLIVPARRKYLLTFSGEYIYDKSMPMTFSLQHFNQNGTVGPELLAKNSGKQPYMTSNTSQSRHLLEAKVRLDYVEQSDTLKTLLYFENTIVEVLKSMQTQVESDGFYFEFICSGDNEKLSGVVNGEWTLCGDDTYRTSLLNQSTFSLILAPTNYSIVSTMLMQWRIFESLRSGAIPVILGDYVRLPFDDVITWSKALIFLPKSRITELHFYLRTFTDADVLEMRRQGRMIFETYLGSITSVIDTVLTVVRTRLKIPAFSMHEEPSPSVFNDSFVPIKEAVIDAMLDSEEILGPVEPSMNSLRYRRNFTMGLDGHALPGDPFHLYPFTPFEPVIPADAKFIGSSYGFRPIGHGAGGAGKEFGEALGGNNPREQFTVVILTYEREAVLISAVARLKGLPHLNKVIVVWNNLRPPSEDLRWPDIGIEVHVIRTAKNSLNNRFLPYDAIKTEAILSLDDDAHLRHDEIMFGFRIWREARDRIVGFPGRYNAWDLNHESWLYNSNYSCELSMVLTGAAFFHKYYAFLYSYVMPQAIRDKVDEYMNCEDLAMNFLVSHITRKPPIKVTSRWTFRCPGCPKALSVEDSHFHERHKCLNFFVQVYGYMPLLNTQYRADSVLFKTRIPHDKQKCFKFI